MPLRVRTVRMPSIGDVEAIGRLVARARERDGREPLSDQALTRLGSGSVEHLFASADGTVVGYAQVAGEFLELLGTHDALAALLDDLAGRPLSVWSHGRTSPVAALLDERGFVAERELFQLRRPLGPDEPAPAVPDGVRVEPFVVGRDEDAWLAVNAAAFAHHPEQGGWTLADLVAREAESWFDPSGFLLAWRDDALAGFHWTKIHPDGAGEVYVIAVAPAGQGLGLGTVLLHLGLAHLCSRGCTEVLLYVDGTNTAARALYAKHGFVEHDLDVQWAGTPQP